MNDDSTQPTSENIPEGGQESSNAQPSQPSLPTENTIPTTVVTQPVASIVDVAANEPAQNTLPVSSISNAPQTNRRHLKELISSLVALLMLAAAFGGGYAVGHQKTTSSVTPASTSAAADIQVPKGATIISQCTAGLGMQYIMPKDIPTGPIYSVYKGKVIGLEFMASSTTASINTIGNATSPTSTAAKDGIISIPLFQKSYDRMDVSLMPSGHAGFSVPHYMLDLLMVPKSVTDQITCGGSSSMNMNSTSTTDTQSSMGM